jgi:hypothetical protein
VIGIEPQQQFVDLRLTTEEQPVLIESEGSQTDEGVPVGLGHYSRRKSGMVVRLLVRDGRASIAKSGHELAPSAHRYR